MKKVKHIVSVTGAYILNVLIMTIVFNVVFCGIPAVSFSSEVTLLSQTLIRGKGARCADESHSRSISNRTQSHVESIPARPWLCQWLRNCTLTYIWKRLFKAGHGCQGHPQIQRHHSRSRQNILLRGQGFRRSWILRLLK